MRYLNPVIKGFHPDPSICFDGEFFYLVTSTFEFFPGVPVFRSKNLANWELIGHCLNTDGQLPLLKAGCSGGIYAPTIRHHEGMFYMTTTNISHRGHLIVHAENPAGPWSEPVYVDQEGIDPSLLFDEDAVYFVSTCSYGGHSAIAMCEVNPLTGEKTRPTRIVSYGGGGKYPEAPHLYKINGKYYLMLAEGGTEYGHMVTIFRGDDPYGPYEPCPHNPILSHRNVPSGDIQCTGHADIVQDLAGNWWMVALGVRPLGPMLHNLGRETFLAPVIWRDGWPVVNGGNALALAMDAPLPGEAHAPETAFTDDFEAGELKKQWTFVRNPRRENYRLTEGAVRLTGAGESLTALQPTFMGVRQTEFHTETRVEIELNENAVGGLSAFYNGFYYYALRLSRKGDGLYAEMEKHLHDELSVGKPLYLGRGGKATLRLTTDRQMYRFSAITDQGETLIGQGSTAGLSTEGTMMMTFTGVFIGLFAAEGEAEFRHFEYKELEAPCK